MDRGQRVQAVRNLLAQYNSNAAFITHLPHIRWLCGFAGTRALALVTPDSGYFLTDHRYTAEAMDLACGLEPHVVDGRFNRFIRDRGWLDSTAAVLVQSERMSVAEFHSWKESFEHINWHPVAKLLARHVAVKSPAERTALETAQSITDRVFEGMLDYISPGMTEHAIASEIDFRHRQLGTQGMAFDTIVASGPNSARPHARPGSRVLKDGDCVILDCGCLFDGMVSDMTRTVFLGRPTNEMRSVYEIVREAQQRAIDCAGADVDARAVDRQARQVIEKAGYGAMFKHSTGHGLGYEVHEWPRISPRSADTLPLGCVITIEPGIYLEGQFGIRIEDAVWVEKQGSQRLPASTRELICL